MSQSMVIRIEVHGVAQAAAQLRQLGNSFGGLGGGWSGPAGGVARRRAPGQPAPFEQRLDTVAVGAAGRRVPIRAAPFEQRLDTLVRSTRFGAGAASPLIGRSLDLLGQPRGAGGPLMLAAVGAAGAIKFLGDAAMGAAKHFTAIEHTVRSTGGTTAQVGTLMGAGLGAAQVAGLAEALRAKISGDSFGMMAGMRLGVGPQLPGPFGSTNQAGDLVKVIEGFRKLGRAEQTRIARMLGEVGDALIGMAAISATTFEEITMHGRMRAALITPQQTQSAADFNAKLKDMQANFGAAKDQIGSLFLPALNQLMDSLGKWALGMAIWTKENQNLMIDLLALPFGLAGQAAKPWVKGALQDAQAKATADNTRAVLDNTMAIRAGIFGGGGRARSLFPSSLRGEILKRAIEGDSLRLGAFVP